MTPSVSRRARSRFRQGAAQLVDGVSQSSLPQQPDSAKALQWASTASVTSSTPSPVSAVVLSTGEDREHLRIRWSDGRALGGARDVMRPAVRGAGAGKSPRRGAVH